MHQFDLDSLQTNIKNHFDLSSYTENKKTVTHQNYGSYYFKSSVIFQTTYLYPLIIFNGLQLLLKYQHRCFVFLRFLLPKWQTKLNSQNQPKAPNKKRLC